MVDSKECSACNDLRASLRTLQKVVMEQREKINLIKNIVDSEDIEAFADKFRQIFGRDLAPFWDHFTGFDIIKFDKFMQDKKGRIEDGKTSLSDFILKKYGEDAEKFIKKIICL